MADNVITPTPVVDNTTFNQDFWISLARRFLTFLAGALVSHGIISAKAVDSQLIEMGAGALVLLVNTWWSAKQQKAIKEASATKAVATITNQTTAPTSTGPTPPTAPTPTA